MRKKIYDVLEMTNAQDFLSRAFSLFVVVLISINIICIVLESIPELNEKHRSLFFSIEIISTTIFAVEYVLRLWSCVESKIATSSPVKTRIRYALSPLAIVDLLAFLPSILQLLFPGIDLRFLRVLRLLRVFKLTRYFSSFELLLNVLHEERKNLAGIFVLLLVILTLAASALYLVERDIQPDKFGSIPQAMWWAIAALTTVGYGDVYPLSTAGQLLGSLVTIVGIGMVALPSGILASAFSEHQRRNREFLQIAIDDALADGVMDSAELRAIQELGKSVGLSEEKTIDFIKHARKVDGLTHHKSDHS
jgi:voltage-gated potassium channel